MPHSLCAILPNGKTLASNSNSLPTAGDIEAILSLTLITGDMEADSLERYARQKNGLEGCTCAVPLAKQVQGVPARFFQFKKDIRESMPSNPLASLHLWESTGILEGNNHYLKGPIFIVTFDTKEERDEYLPYSVEA